MNNVTKLRYMSNQYGNSVLPDDIFVDYVKSKQFFYIAGWSGAELYKRISGNVTPKMGLLDYKAASNHSLYDGSSGDKTVSLGYPGMYDNFIMVRDLSFNGNTEKFKEFIIGNNVWFELETPAQGGYLPINKTRYITPTKNLFNIGLSTDWQPPVNNSYGYVPLFIGIGKTCTISWDLEYYRKHPAPYNLYMCINKGEQPSNTNREWLYHSSFTWAQNSQVTVSANSTGYIYFELADGFNSNKEYLEKYIFNENLKWQLELGNQKTDYVPHGYLPYTKLRYKASDVCQLLDKSKYPATREIAGITFTNN